MSKSRNQHIGAVADSEVLARGGELRGHKKVGLGEGAVLLPEIF